MHHHHRLLIGALLILAGVLSAHNFNAEPAVLIIGNTTEHHISPGVMGELRDAGYRLEWLELRHRQPDWDRLPELIPQANVIVMMGAGTGSPEGTVSERHETYFAAIDRFARKGGGVLYMTAERYPPSYVAGGIFLQRWGARLGKEWIHNAGAVEKTAWAVPFAFTRDVRESPVTEGVRGLWYPTFWDYRTGSARQARVVRFADPVWQVVLTGGPQGYSVPQASEIKYVREMTAPTGYEVNPPLWAIRELEQGRVAVTGVTYAYFLGKATLSTLDSIVWERGLDNIPSDGKRLLLNTLEWLAEPSMKTRGPGPMPDNPELLTPRDVAPIERPLDWDRQTFATDPDPRQTAVIGARTTRTTGIADVAAWKDAARAADLDVLVFLEPLEELTEAEFNSLKTECRELSDADIWLIPGFTYANFIGARSYAFDPDLPFPPAKFLTADGSRFNDGVEVARKNQRGQLSYLRQRWQYGVCARKVMTGWYDFENCPIPSPDLGQYDTLPIVEAHGIEERQAPFAVYQQALRDQQRPQPIALQFVDDPALLAKPLWRTEFLFADHDALRAWFDAGYSSRADTKPDHVATNGPEILNWEALGKFHYQWTNEDAYVWQNARRVLRLRARYAPGIREVKVYDGDRLVRRFLPDGPVVERQFTADNRGGQAEFFVEVIGVDGRRAVSGAHAHRAHAMQQVNCSDRNNQLPSSHQRRADGSWLRIGYLAGCPDKRTGFMRTQPARSFSSDVRLGLAAFDGAAQHAGYPSLAEAPLLRINESYNRLPDVRQCGWSAEANGSHHIASLALAGMDAIVGDREVTRIFADNVPVVHVWSTMWRLEPREWSIWTQRRWLFRCKPDQPALFGRWDYTLTLKKDVSYLTDESLGLHGPTVSPSEATLWSVGTTGDSLGAVAAGAFGEAVHGAQGIYDFGPGAWVACLESPGGGAIVFSLTPGLKLATIGQPAKPRGWTIGLVPEDSPKAAGESRGFSLVVVGIPRYVPEYSQEIAARDPVRTAARIKAHLGFGRAPAYSVDWQVGTPVAEDFFCRARADNGAALASLGALDNPVANVPVVVDGLNPNWTVMVNDTAADCRPVAQFEGRAVLMLLPDEERTIFLGHPVIADHEDLVLSVTRAAPNAWDLEIHNPADAPLEARVQTHPAWPRFRCDEHVTVPAGSSIYRRVGRE